MGVDVALNQADLMGHLIAEEMSLDDMVTLLKLRKGQFSLVEKMVDPLAVAAGKAVRELNLPIQCVLVTIIRKGELTMPHGDFVLQPDGEVLAVVHAENVTELAGLLGEPQESMASVGAGQCPPAYAGGQSVNKPLAYAGLNRLALDQPVFRNEQF